MKPRPFLDRWKKKLPQEVFGQTSLRLTLFYSGIITLFLIIFVIIVLFILYGVIYADQERKITELANRETNEFQEDGFRRHRPQQREGDKQVFLSENQLFYYVAAGDGSLVSANESFGPLRPLFLDLVKNWTPGQSEIRQKTLQIPEDDADYSQFRDFDIRVLMLARPVIINGQAAGMMYIGLDISNLNTIFKWVVIVLSSLAAVFIGIGVWLSRMMSRRALIPIEKSYNQQREFVANASHELRTPLSVIFSSVEAIEMELEDPDPFTRKMMNGLKHEVKRMTKLINDLLTLARSDSADGAVLERKWEDMRPLGAQVLDSFESFAAEKQIRLSLHAPEQVMVHADSGMLVQLLYILVDNAIKYSPSGGEVSVNLGVKWEKQSGIFVLSVKDTGMGMSREEQAQVFDRFFRADKARSRKEGGHGLGLSIAKWIADVHRGRITVESEPGEGTEFRVVIPFEKTIKYD